METHDIRISIVQDHSIPTAPSMADDSSSIRSRSALNAQTLENLRRSPSISSVSTTAPSQKQIKSFAKLHKQQLDKLTERNEEDTELIEVVREYLRRRQELEASHLKDLEKLNKQFLQRSLSIGGNTGGFGKNSSVQSLVGNDPTPTVERRSSISSTVDGGAPRKLRRNSISKAIENSELKSSPNHQDGTDASEGPSGESSRRLSLTSTINYEASQAENANSKNAQSKLGRQGSILRNVRTNLLQRTVVIAFHSLLHETDKTIKQRQSCLENIVPDLVDRCKDLAKVKRATHKKLAEQIMKLQNDVLAEYTDLEKTRKNYEDAYKAYKQALHNYIEIHSKGKVGLMGLMRSKEDIKDRSKKKLNESELLLKQCRNEYLVQHEITNSVHMIYYQDVLPCFLRSIDGNYYKLFSNFMDTWNKNLSAYAGAISQACAAVDQSIAAIDRESEAKLFMESDNAKSLIQAPFFPLLTEEDDDPHVVYLPDEFKRSIGTTNPLDVLLPLQNDLNNIIKVKEKQVLGLQNLKDVYWKNPKFGDVENMINSDVSSVSEMINSRLLYGKVSSQVRIWSECLPSEMQNIQKDSATKESSLNNIVAVVKGFSNGNDRRKAVKSYLEIPTSSKQTSNATKQLLDIVHDIPQQLPTTQQAAPVSTNTEDEVAPSKISLVQTWDGIALYSYLANSPSELNLTEGADVEIMEDPTIRNDGWVLCRENGKTGVVPISYVKLKGQNPFLSSLVTLQGESTEGKAAEDSDEATMELVKCGFNYAAKVEGELSFSKNDIIEVISKETGSEEWWKGRLLKSKQEGEFPVAYVKKLTIARKSRAKYDYNGEVSEDLTVEQNDLIYVVKTRDENWIEGIHVKEGRYGLIPTAYLE